MTSQDSNSTVIDVTGDAGDIFMIRWDDDLATAGYQGTTKFQSGGGINPLGDLKAANFINVAGVINPSGGGSNPSGLQSDVNQLNTAFGETVNGGGFFTGYWFVTGDPTDGVNGNLSNAIIVGSLYTSATDITLTSGTSGVYGTPPAAAAAVVPLPASLSLLLICLGGLVMRRKLKKTA